MYMQAKIIKIINVTLTIRHLSSSMGKASVDLQVLMSEDKRLGNVANW
jgi:hypothetical protein